MQEAVTNLENRIEQDIEQHKNSYGYLRELITNNLLERYDTLRSYHRNLPSRFHMPKYERISSYIDEHVRPEDGMR